MLFYSSDTGICFIDAPDDIMSTDDKSVVILLRHFYDIIDSNSLVSLLHTRLTIRNNIKIYYDDVLLFEFPVITKTVAKGIKLKEGVWVFQLDVGLFGDPCYIFLDGEMKCIGGYSRRVPCLKKPDVRFARTLLKVRSVL